MLTDRADPASVALRRKILKWMGFRNRFAERWAQLRNEHRLPAHLTRDVRRRCGSVATALSGRAGHQSQNRKGHHGARGSHVFGVRLPVC